MRSFQFFTVDVFTDRRFGGNPLAVFPDARGLSDAEMQSLAAELNLSETTFVLPAENPAHTARVRIFNRTAEMPFAGHPNVGTAYVLASREQSASDVLRFEELAGLVEVHLQRDHEGKPLGATIAAPQPLTLGMTLPRETIAAMTELTPADIVVDAHMPIWASVGNPYIIAEVTRDALGRALPNIGVFREALAERPALNGRLALFVYAPDGERFRARMFSPLAGTFEDPATGSANAPLAALRLSLTGESRIAFDVMQGVEMGRPSLLHVTAERGADGIRATVGGTCVPVLRGEALV